MIITRIDRFNSKSKFSGWVGSIRIKRKKKIEFFLTVNVIWKCFFFSLSPFPLAFIITQTKWFSMFFVIFLGGFREGEGISNLFKPSVSVFFSFFENNSKAAFIFIFFSVFFPFHFLTFWSSHVFMQFFQKKKERKFSR